MNNTYEPCGEEINEPTPPEHEAQDDCRNPSNQDGCQDYVSEVWE